MDVPSKQHYGVYMNIYYMVIFLWVSCYKTLNFVSFELFFFMSVRFETNGIDFGHYWRPNGQIYLFRSTACSPRNIGVSNVNQTASSYLKIKFPVFVRQVGFNIWPFASAHSRNNIYLSTIIGLHWFVDIVLFKRIHSLSKNKSVNIHFVWHKSSILRHEW